MTWGIRRIAFTIGAILLVGGWGVTGYVNAYQHAAGAAAGERWREGEHETTAMLRPSAQVETEPNIPDGAPATAAAPRPGIRNASRSTASAAALTLTRQVTPPSSWLYLFGVLVMMSGAGLMALTVPWRGARMAAAAEIMPHHQRHNAPALPKMPSGQSAAAAFPGMPPVKAAHSVAAPVQPPPDEPPAGKGRVKPLKYKKGA